MVHLPIAPSAGVTLGAGEECNISVVFTAQLAGTLGSGSANVSDDSLNAVAFVTQSIPLTGSVLSTSTITFPAIVVKTAGDSIALTATCSDGLPVFFSSSTATVCTVSGSSASLIAAGTCSIVAFDNGNGTYSGAPPVTQSFTVMPATPSTNAIYVGLDTTTQGTWTGKYGKTAG